MNYDPETYARHPTVGISTGSDTSELLRLDQFGFEIPLGSRIDELWVRGLFLYAGSVGGSHNSEIRELSLFFNNTAQGDEKSENVPYLSTEDDPAILTFGGPPSFWDVELTPQIVNDPAFAVQFRSWKSTNKATMRVYYVGMNIHFTALR